MRTVDPSVKEQTSVVAHVGLQARFTRRGTLGTCRFSRKNLVNLFSFWQIQVCFFSEKNVSVKKVFTLENAKTPNILDTTITFFSFRYW